MTDILILAVNAVVLFAVVSHSLSEKKEVKPLKILKAIKKSSQNKITEEQKRDIEILDQIQRYDGTRILRKEER